MRPSNPSRNTRPWSETRRVISSGDMITYRQVVSPPTSKAVFLDGLRAHRCEEIDQVAVGIAKEQGPISPRHRRRLLNHVADHRLEFPICSVDVIDAELDDRGMVVGRTS